MSEKISLYNPRDTPPEQLEAMLTGREPLLKEILDSLRDQAEATTRQHWLLRGPRGMGKTHLTGIIHHRVRNDPTLSRVYLPLWLGEADVYEVYSPATLLERIAERLVETVPGALIEQELRTLEGTGDEDALFEELTAHLTEEAKRQERTLLVLMENLDALFESFAPKQRNVQMRQLRSLLLDNPRFLFISTTPTRYLKELSNPKAPLYAQLKERKLSPLSVEDVGLLFSKLAQMTGRKELLGQGPEAVLRQRIIHQLTGGLPRSVVMAFEVLRDKEGIQSLVEDLRALLDAQTAYFEARLSKFAPRERAIVTTLALAEQNLTLKEIAAKSRLPEKSLSTLVARLEQEGHVAAMEGQGGKGTPYAIREGLFRIWYQYRKGKMLLEPLVHFLAGWYRPEELQSVAEDMRKQLEQQELKVARTARLALLQVEAAFQIASSERGRIERQRIWDEGRRSEEEIARREYTNKLPGTLKKALADGIGLLLSGKTNEGRTHLERAIASYKPLTEQIALGIFRFARQTSFNDEAAEVAGKVEAFQWLVAEIRKQAKDRPEAILPELAFSLLGLSFWRSEHGSWKDALEEVREAVRHFRVLAKKELKSFRPALASSLSMLSLVLSELGRGEEALKVTREAVEHYRSLVEEEPELFRPGLAASLNELGEVLGELGRGGEALKAMREAVGHYRVLAEKDLESFRPNLASSLSALGGVLRELGSREEALEVTREAVELSRVLAEKDLEPFRPNLADRLHNLGLVLGELERAEDALAAIREAVGHYRVLAEKDPESFRPDLADNLGVLGEMLEELKRQEEALGAMREAVEHYRVLVEKKPESFRLSLASNLSNLGLVLRKSGKMQEALEAMREAVEHYRVLAEKKPESFWPDLASGLNNLGLVLWQLKREEDALVVVREAVERCRTLAEKEPESFRPLLCYSLNNLAVVLKASKRGEEALVVMREAVERYRALAEKQPEDFRSSLAGGLNNLGLVLSDLNRRKEALEAMREAVGHYSQLAEEHPERSISDLANSVINLALQQSALGRRAEALASVQLGLAKSPAETVTTFTSNPTRFFKQLPAKEVNSWLEQMLKAELPLELKEQLRLHHQVSTLLVERENGAPEEHIRQALGRVPPELRELVENILRRGKQS